jgi:serine/threonine protein kinase
MWESGDIILEKYQVVKFLTNGAFSKIFLVKNLCNQEQLILKFYNQRELDRATPKYRKHLLDRIISEVTNQKPLHHPNIVRLLDWQQTPLGYYVFLQRSGTRDLFEYIQHLHSKRKRLTEKQIREIFTQLVSAIEYLHQQNIGHRDIKSENVFIEEVTDQNGELKIQCRLGDFDWSHKMDVFGLCCAPNSDYYAGTIQCASPEALKQFDVGRPADIWGLGIILYEMLTNGFSPWPCTPYFMSDACKKSNCDHSHSGMIRHFLDHLESSKIGQRRLVRASKPARDLVHHLLHPIPEMRFTLAQIWDSPWMMFAVTDQTFADSSEEDSAKSKSDTEEQRSSASTDVLQHPSASTDVLQHPNVSVETLQCPSTSVDALYRPLPDAPIKLDEFPELTLANLNLSIDEGLAILQAGEELASRVSTVDALLAIPQTDAPTISVSKAPTSLKPPNAIHIRGFI